MAFAHTATPLLYRLRVRPRTSWLCSTFPNEHASGRGAWDLDRTPPDRSLSRARPSQGENEGRVRREGRENGRYGGRDGFVGRENGREKGRDGYVQREGRGNRANQAEGSRGGSERGRWDGKSRDEEKGGWKGREMERGDRRGREEERGGWRGRDNERGGSRGREEERGGWRGREHDRGVRRGREEDRGGWRGRDENRGGSRGRQEEKGGYGDPGTRQGWEGDEGKFETGGHFGGRGRAGREVGELSIVQRALAATEDELLYGINPVLLALLSGKRGRFVRLYVQDRSERGGSGGVVRKAANEVSYEKLMGLAAGKDLPVVKLPKGDLNALSGNRPHQGVVLQAGQMEYEELKYLPVVEEGSVNERGAPFCYLVLDEVSDPQNAGALMRSAHFLGADGVICCRKNSCRLSAVVSKASAGAVEVMGVRGVASMPRFLKKARQDGWRVVGTELGGEAVSVKEVGLQRPTLVVMGSEGHGLRSLVKQECDVLVKIEGGRGGVADVLGLKDEPVDSLNVSVAGAVTLFQLLGK